jgi:hypothetical protein
MCNISRFYISHYLALVPKIQFMSTFVGASGGLRTRFLEDFCYGCRLPRWLVPAPVAQSLDTIYPLDKFNQGSYILMLARYIGINDVFVNDQGFVYLVSVCVCLSHVASRTQHLCIHLYSQGSKGPTFQMTPHGKTYFADHDLFNV